MKENGVSIISWINGNNINFREDSTTSGNLKVVESESAKQVNLLCTNDLTGVYKDTLLRGIIVMKMIL